MNNTVVRGMVLRSDVIEVSDDLWRKLRRLADGARLCLDRHRVRLEDADTGLLGRRTSALLDRPDGPDREVSLGGQLLDRQLLLLAEALHELPESFSSRLPASDQPDLVTLTHTPSVPQMPTGSDI